MTQDLNPSTFFIAELFHDFNTGETVLIFNMFGKTPRSIENLDTKHKG